jgi:eukaryotic-like serine/threonine-protein kinase
MQRKSPGDPRESPFEEGVGLATAMARLFGSSAPAARVGRFTLIERVGEGAMGQVWAAWDPQLDRRVALKLLHAGDGSEDERVLREARTMASINHPNVAQVYEVGSERGRIFIAMEFVAGATLGQWLSASTRSWQEVLRMYAQAGRGLEAAHDAGVVHRDFKPDNALVGEDGRVRVVDFGLAHAQESMTETDRSESSSAPATATLTRPRAGTPAYMAPEQFRGEGVDARADQFAFCVALFEGLTGRRPFDGTSSIELLERIERGEIPLDRLPSRLPSRVRVVLRRGLQPKREDRFVSMAELLGMLVIETGRTQRRLIIGSLVVGAVGATTLAFAMRPNPCPTSAQLEGIWNQERNDEVRAALERAGPSFVPNTWPQIAEALDAYVRAWNAEHVDACEATHIRHEQSASHLDARMRCLATRKTALIASLRTLLDADFTVAENATKLLAALPPVDRCADADYVHAAEPLPDDPDVAREVEQEEEKVARAEAELTAGRLSVARELTAEALERARALGYAPLTARALHAHGGALAALAEVDAAEPPLIEAYRLARASSDFDLAGSAAVRLAFLLARFTTRRDQARAWAIVGEIEATLIDDVSLRAAAHNAYGVAAILSEDREAAGHAFERAVELLQGHAVPSLLTYRSNLARFHRHAGRIEEASALHEQIVHDATVWLGPDHPALVGFIEGLAETWQILGRASDAERELERALEIVLQSRGEIHPDTTSILSALGHCKFRLNKLEEARELLERGVQLSEELGATGAQTAVAGLAWLAEVYMALEQPEKALEHMRRNVEQQERWMGPRSRDTAVARGRLATMLLQIDRSDDALDEIERAIEIFEDVLGPEHIDLSQARQVRAEVLAAHRRTEEAIVDLERAIEIRAQALGSNSHKQADLYFSLAEVHHQQGAHDAAIAAGERALELVVGHEDFLPHEVAGVQFLVARALIAAGRDRDRAATLARAALAGLQEGPPAVRKRAAEVAAWLRDTELETE